MGMGLGERPFLKKLRECAPPLQSMGMGLGERPFLRELRGCAPPFQSMGMGLGERPFLRAAQSRMLIVSHGNFLLCISAINF